MDHMRILKRAWHITFDYRVLWLFGFLFALTSVRGSGSSGSGGSGRGTNNGTIPAPNMPDMPQFNPPANVEGTIIAVIIGLVCFFLLLGLAFVVLRHLSQTTLIRLVDEYEATGVKVSVREGFRRGWSWRAVKIFLINLLFTMIFIIGLILMLLVALAPLLLWSTQNESLGVLGTFLTIGLVFLTVFILIVTASLVGVLQEFFWRAAVLENRGVFDSIRRGFSLVFHHLGDVIVMGLIMFGLGLAYGILMIPVFILMALLALVTGGLPGLLAGAITALFEQGALPWIIGVLVALPVFLLVLAAPLSFIGGLWETFKSAVWTMTFRETLALEAAGEGALPPPQPEAGPDDAGAEPEDPDL